MTNLYVSKPQQVEAVQWTGSNYQNIRAELGGKVHLKLSSATDSTLMLKAGVGGAQEWVPVPVGHWLVHPPGDTDDVWPVEHDYFQAKYQTADVELR